MTITADDGVGPTVEGAGQKFIVGVVCLDDVHVAGDVHQFGVGAKLSLYDPFDVLSGEFELRIGKDAEILVEDLGGHKQAAASLPPTLVQCLQTTCRERDRN